MATLSLVARNGKQGILFTLRIYLQSKIAKQKLNKLGIKIIINGT